MLGVLDHPRLIHEWFTTTLLRWNSDHYLIIYDRWAPFSDGWVKGGGGEVILDFYYLMYFTAFLMAIFLMTHYRKTGWLRVRAHVPYDALLVGMLGVLMGAKFAYIFIYNPEFYFSDPPIGPDGLGDMLQRIFLNWSGMASHGAVFGVLMGALLWRLKSKAPVAHIADVGAIASAFGAACVRAANFMNAELYGRAAPDWLPWAMRFPVSNGRGNRLHMLAGEWYQWAPKTKDLPAHWEMSDEPYRLGYELMHKSGETIRFFKPDQIPPELQNVYLQVITSPRHPSQLYQLLVEGLLVFAILLFLRTRVKRVGMLVAAFFICYPLARFAVEFFRQPDVQFQAEGNPLGTAFLGMSVGQLLSVAMFGLGMIFFFYFRKYGTKLDEMEIWPPKKKEKQDESLKVPFEPGMGGSTAAGPLTGIMEVREALAEKEKEWAEEFSAEGQEEKPDDPEDPAERPTDDREPGQSD